MEEPIPSFSDPDSGDPGSLTYEFHFGLREKPFSLSPNPRFFLKNSSHAEAFDALIAGIRRREGILVLTGEVGTGKTTLCRAVLESLDRKTFAAFVPDPILSREDLLKTLLIDFGVVSIDDIKADRLRGASRTELSYTLYEFLTSLQPLHAFAVVMIDEAQNLPTTLLEEIRILSDMEHGQKLLQLVLIGQPELQARLSMPEMRQLKQRLTVRSELSPLAHGEVGPYVAHRLGIAGNNKQVFEAAAIDLIYAASAGIPRVINLLCDRALLRAAAAGATAVSAEHIVGAADDLWIPWGASATPVLEPPVLEPPVTAPASAKPTEQILLESKRRSPAPRQGLPSTYQMRHDTHYVEELEARRERAMSETWAKESPDSESAIFAENRPTKRFLTVAVVAAAALVLSAASVWLLRSSANQVSGSPSIETARESTNPPLDNRPANVALPEGAPSAALSPPPATPQPAVVSSGTDAPKFAVQMATFRTGARATESVRELGAAGYDAFIAEVSLRDGGRAFAVFLGPYTDRTAAGRNMERAQLLPGYGIGRIVQMGPTTSGSYRWQAE